MAALVDDVGVNHGGRHVLVAEESLDGANVRTAFQEVGGKTVSEGVGGNAFGDAGLSYCSGDRAVDDVLMDVMPAFALRIPRGDGVVEAWDRAKRICTTDFTDNPEQQSRNRQWQKHGGQKYRADFSTLHIFAIPIRGPIAKGAGAGIRWLALGCASG